LTVHFSLFLKLFFFFSFSFSFSKERNLTWSGSADGESSPEGRWQIISSPKMRADHEEIILMRANKSQLVTVSKGGGVSPSKEAGFRWID
jgi:hypothetical protein